MYSGPKQSVEADEEQKEADDRECLNHSDQCLTVENSLGIGLPGDTVDGYIEEI